MQHLISLQSSDNLLSLLPRLKQKDVACISGFADDWDNILAYDVIDRFQLNDIKQLPQLHEFVQRHQEHLVIGSFSYDLGLLLHQLNSRHQITESLVELHAYSKFIIETDTGLWGYQVDQTQLDSLLTPQNNASVSAPDINWHDGITIADYLPGFDKIQQYIRAGDMYQINYTHQIPANCEQSGKDLFVHFMTEKPVSHAAYMHTEQHEIISLSPEGFISVENGKITTQPIKGTRPRSADAMQDAKLREELINSTKEQAELFMIVDLLRNDLGKVCRTGTVRVMDPKIVTGMPNVWHTHATITGQLKENVSTIDALLSMFPGGSITGCPKLRAMEITDEIEQQARGIYTGSLGYILPTGKAAFNIAIRTLVKQGPDMHLGVGGGITIKSEGAEEYAETAAKAAFFK